MNTHELEVILQPISELVDKLVLEPADAPLEPAIRRLREVKTRVAVHIHDSLDIKNLESDIARIILNEAIRRERPIEECRRYLADAASIGFRHIAHQCRVLVTYSRYCVEKGEVEEAIGRLAEFKQELIKLSDDASRSAYDVSPLKREVELLLEEYSQRS